MLGKQCMHSMVNLISFWWVRMVLPYIFLASFPGTSCASILETPEQQFPVSCWEWTSNHTDFCPGVDHSVSPSPLMHSLLVSSEPHFCVHCSGSPFLQSILHSPVNDRTSQQRQGRTGGLFSWNFKWHRWKLSNRASVIANAMSSLQHFLKSRLYFLE